MLSKPHPRILAMLQGPDVPDDFVCDGCSMSPDGWFYWACRIHDFEANELRARWMLISMFVGEPKVSFENYYRLYVEAKDNLRDNIRILSTFYIDGKGNLRVRPFWHPKRLIGWQLAKLYAGVTGSLFKWATIGKGKA